MSRSPEVDLNRPIEGAVRRDTLSAINAATAYCRQTCDSALIRRSIGDPTPIPGALDHPRDSAAAERCRAYAAKYLLANDIANIRGWARGYSWSAKQRTVPSTGRFRGAGGLAASNIEDCAHVLGQGQCRPSEKRHDQQPSQTYKRTTPTQQGASLNNNRRPGIAIVTDARVRIPRYRPPVSKGRERVIADGFNQTAGPYLAVQASPGAKRHRGP